ncbi:hypothetical protein [Neisseria sp. Ec49-e6-T10]|uniref:hypothetical protein n=1 Tax=Neisseria sp. Ec49-e6-T10 TaxID=3140744 RepID=UPI003EC13CAA
MSDQQKKPVKNMTADVKPICFAIMPISDVDTHPKGHFHQVYEDIMIPAIGLAGFEPKRADEEKGSNLIQLKILEQLIEAPMAICDLSTRNPNVMFELGIRQAFDKPTVLIQEEGTPHIFDINGLRYLTYSRDLEYRNVLDVQTKLADALKQTLHESEKSEGIHSIVRLLALKEPAKIPELNPDVKSALETDLIYTELAQIKKALALLAEQKQSYGQQEAILSFLGEHNDHEQDRRYEAFVYHLADLDLDKDAVPKELMLSSCQRLLQEVKEEKIDNLSAKERSRYHRLTSKILELIAYVQTKP